MQLLALVKRLDHVCCRYRLAAYRPFLEKAGHHLEIRSWPTSWLSRLLLRRRLGPADAVIVQRKLVPSWQWLLLRRSYPLLIYDFDDAVFMRDSNAWRGHSCPRRIGSFAAMVRTANLVVCGNDFLRAQATLWTDPERVHLIPTCVNPDRYPLAEHDRPGGEVQLAWIGAASTLKGLARNQALLEELGQGLPGVTLKLICDRFLRLRHLPVIPRPWSDASEAAELASADIGISWLPDDPWSRGKCALKILQYMAAGLPVVANRVGLQARLVRHGENGFLADSADEWRQAIQILARDPALRRRLGRAGRALAETRFHVSVGAARWLTLLQRSPNLCSSYQPASAPPAGFRPEPA